MAEIVLYLLTEGSFQFVLILCLLRRDIFKIETGMCVTFLLQVRLPIDTLPNTSSWSPVEQLSKHRCWVKQVMSVYLGVSWFKTNPGIQTHSSEINIELTHANFTKKDWIITSGNAAVQFYEIFIIIFSDVYLQILPPRRTKLLSIYSVIIIIMIDY